MSTTQATSVNPNLRALVKAGTSPWLDLLRRSLVQGGEPARMIAEDSLRGVTSSPSIFEKAILGSEDYDQDPRPLPAQLADPAAARVTRATREGVAQRVWRKDPSLWGGQPGTRELDDRLGWLTVADKMLQHAPALNAFVAQCRSDGYTDAVLLGMGGSSLGPEVIRRSFGEVPDGLRPQVLDSTHPDTVLEVERSLDLAKTMFIISSKSGGTIETLSHYHHFRAKAKPEQFVVITDPGSPLERLARDAGLRHTFLNAPDIGGRYSVMSYFGLVPAAMMGVNIVFFLAEFATAVEGWALEINPFDQPERIELEGDVVDALQALTPRIDGLPPGA